MMDMLALLPENSKNRYDSRHRLVTNHAGIAADDLDKIHERDDRGD
jgi:hypothetical protein